MKLSLCMIVKNEAAFLPDCLASVAGLVDELIIVDTGSTDGTPDIATQAGALVIDEPWADDFAAARNVALAAAGGDWILVLDADERLSAATKQLLLDFLPTAPDLGYQLRIRNLADADPDSVVEHYALRLFPNRPDLRYHGLVHEQLISIVGLELERQMLPQSLVLHEGYRTQLVVDRDKVSRNLQLLQRELERDPQNPLHHFHHAQTLLSLEQFDAARVAYEEVVTLCQVEIPIYLDTALIQLQKLAMRELDWSLLAHWLEQGQDICQLNPDFWFHTGILAVEQGRISDGIAAFTQAYELGRQEMRVAVCDRANATWKPFIAIAQAHQRTGDGETAQLFLDACREAYPELNIFMEQNPDDNSTSD